MAQYVTFRYKIEVSNKGKRIEVENTFFVELQACGKNAA